MSRLIRWLLTFFLTIGTIGNVVAQEAKPDKEKNAASKPSDKPSNPLLDACLRPNDTQSVILACTTAIESRQLQGEDLAAVLSRRGIAHSRRAQGPAAVNDFSAVLKITPQAIDVLYARAQLYAAMKRHDLAITDYDVALKLAPGDLDLLYNRAWSKAALGRDETAIEDLTALLGKAKGDVDALMDRGGLYLRLGKFSEAAADFSAVIKQDDKASAAFYNRGRAQFLDGNFSAAAKDFQKAASLRTGNPYASLRQFLAAASVNSKKDLKILTRVMDKIAPEQWPLPILATLAGKMPEKDLLAATKITNRNESKRLEAEAHYYLGEAALIKNDQEAARAHFEAAAKGDRSWPESIDAGWRLKKIE